MVTATQSLTDDMIELFAAEIGAEVRLVDPGEEQEAELLAAFFEDEDEERRAATCGPVRRSSPSWATSTTARRCCSTGSARPNVVAGEAGGITQHIGAYQVERGGPARSPSSTPRATRPSPPCAPAAPR